MNPNNMPSGWLVKYQETLLPVYKIWRGVDLDAYGDFVKLKRESGELELILVKIELEQE